MRRGEAQIEVTFDIDANGILNVSAKENKTGKQQNIRIEASSGVSKEEIEKMKREAAENADADKAAKERIDKLNQADGLIFQVEKQLEELGDKLPADKKQTIQDAVNELKIAHQSQDIAAVEAATTKVKMGVKVFNRPAVELFNFVCAVANKIAGIPLPNKPTRVIIP